jgi:hypothetical protein
VAEEAEIKQVEKELATARRRGGRRSWRWLDILCEDKWFRIATAVYAQEAVRRRRGAGEVIEAARSRLFGLRLEVVEAPLLKIEAAVEQDGSRSEVQSALDVGVEPVFTGAAPGYKLKRRPARQRTADAEAAEKRRWALSVEAAGVETVKRTGAG